VKYLLVMFDKGELADERYGTWGVPAVFMEEKYEPEDEEVMIESIGQFKEDRPNGDVSIHIVEEIGWGSENSKHIYHLIKAGENKAEEISNKKKEAEKQRLLKIKESAE
jgi:hypothetical protein